MRTPFTDRLRVRQRVCVVMGCENTLEDDRPLCQSCHHMLRTGEVRHGRTFIHDLRNLVDDLTRGDRHAG